MAAGWGQVCGGVWNATESSRRGLRAGVGHVMLCHRSRVAPCQVSWNVQRPPDAVGSDYGIYRAIKAGNFLPLASITFQSIINASWGGRSCIDIALGEVTPGTRARTAFPRRGT